LDEETVKRKTKKRENPVRERAKTAPPATVAGGGKEFSGSKKKEQGGMPCDGGKKGVPLNERKDPSGRNRAAVAVSHQEKTHKKSGNQGRGPG